MIRDYLITQKLMNTMQVNNTTLKSQIDAVLSAPRVLDGPPEKYSPVTFSLDSVDPFGVYLDFCHMYAALYGQQPAKDGTVSFGKEKTQCTYEVLTALKTLTVIGVTKSAERAIACRELFGQILSYSSRGKLDKGLIMPAMRLTDDYYKNELTRAIINSIYTEKEQIEILIRNSLQQKYTEDCMELFSDVETVDAFTEKIDKTYKDACRNPNFKVSKSAGKIANVIRYLRA